MSGTGRDLIGSVLSERYRILDVLGDGGMGWVYAAEHVTLRRKIAIKVLKEELARAEPNVERFLQEARAASSISHPNVVDILDFGKIPGGSVFFAMEFLEGEDLAAALARQPRMPWVRVQAIALQVTRGLHAAHRCGVVHRDMKPANIFLVRQPDGSEQVKLLDFGIAKLLRPEKPGNLTGEGTVFGTARYMSPEQAAGLPVDARSDVYAVGILLYEMLSGRVPFDSDNFMRVASQHINEAIPSLRQAAPDADISESVEALVMRALAKDPDDRYPTMAELEAAILGAAIESTVAIHNPFLDDLVDRTTIYERGGARVVPIPASPAAPAVDPTVVKPSPFARNAPPTGVSGGGLAAPSAGPAPAMPPIVSPSRVDPSVVAERQGDQHFFSRPVFGERDDTGPKGTIPAIPAVMHTPSSEPVEHRTLPPVNWTNGNPNPATGANTRGAEGAETDEFVLRLPKHEVSRNWLVIAVAIVALVMVGGGVTAWFLLVDDTPEVSEDLHPTVVADEPRSTVVPDPEPPPARTPAPPAPPAPRADPAPTPVATPAPAPERPATKRRPTKAPRVAKTLDHLTPRDLARGFRRAGSSIEACGTKHGAIAGSKLSLTFDVESGRARNVSVQRPYNVTPLGRCVAAAVENRARFAAATQSSTGVSRTITF